MKKKIMGRPKLPSGESKAVQVGVRFKEKEIEHVSENAPESDKDRSKWIRQAAIEKAFPWVKSEQWTQEDLHGKRVLMDINTPLHGTVVGTGQFDVLKRGDGLLQIRIRTGESGSDPAIKHDFTVFVPQEGVNLIRKLPPGSDADFLLTDRL